MSVINMVENIKKIHPSTIIFYEIGTFYYIYGKDAYIISYIFDYKLKKVEEVYMCGFPQDSYNKVIAKLEEKKINYMILDRRNNYDVDEFCDNKNLNTYTTFFEKARKYINLKIRIESINNYLLENINKQDFKNILNKMEEIINERRKISGN